MSSKPVIITLGLNDAPLNRGLAAATQKVRQFGKAAEDAGHKNVQGTQAASAAIRVLEGNITNNIRAAERFVSTLGGIGPLLQKAFPFIGAAALAGVVFELGDRVAKVVKELNTIPPNPFSDMIASSKVANDQLLIANDRLAMEIAQLEHKPVNGMALALDQARESSDKLYESLMKSNKAFAEAMGKDNIGFFKGLWNNMEPTDAANKDIGQARSGVQGVIADHKTTMDDALDSGNMQDVQQAREAYMVDLQVAYKKQDDRLKAGLAAAQAKQADFLAPYSTGKDQSKVIEKYQGAIAQSQSDQLQAGANYGQSVMQPKKDSLEAAAKNRSEAEKQQRAIFEAWEEALRQDKANAEVSIAQEAAYWAYRLEAAKKGSLSYKLARDEFNKDVARINAESMSTQKSTATKQLQFDNLSQLNPSTMDASRGDNGELKAGGRDASGYLNSLNRSIETNRQNSDAIAEASIKMGLMTGRLSDLDAAQMRAAIHAQDFKKAMDDVNSAIANAQNLPPGLEREATLGNLRNQQSQIAVQGQMQGADDGDAMRQLQIGPAIHDTLNRMAQEWSNGTREIVAVMTRAADSLNANIAAAITGHGSKQDFGRTLSQAGQGLVKAGLQMAEGSILKALGLGKAKKADGSSANPFYVVMASGASASATSQIGGVLGKIPGVGGILGKVGGLLAGMLPGHAAGGDFLAGHPFVAGELGPEIINPGRSGSVTPNNKIGGGGDTHIHVDARGSNDPAATEAAVRRGVHASIAGSVQAQHQARMRSPHGR